VRAVREAIDDGDVGVLGERLDASGLPYRRLRAWEEPIGGLDPGEFSAIIPMGGTAHAWEADRIPILRSEQLLPREAVGLSKLAIDASDAHIISHAAAPNAPSSPHRTMIIVASIPAGLMLGLLAALVAERFTPATSAAHTVRAEAIRGVPLLAEVPGVAHAHAADLVTDWPMSPYAQAIAELAYRVSYGAARGGPRAILITSPQPGEGATTLALSVARAAAKIGRRVVVVDANLAAPSVAPLAGHRAVRNGLTEVLSGKMALSRSLVRDTRSNALILSPTKRQADGRSVLASLQLAQLIIHLRNSCDLLLFCAPPVLSQNGAQPLSRHADAVMLVARNDVAPRPAISEAVDILPRVPAPPIGIVLAS